LFGSLSSSIRLILQGRLKAFAATGAQRSPRYPSCRRCPKQRCPATPQRGMDSSVRPA